MTDIAIAAFAALTGLAVGVLVGLCVLMSVARSVRTNGRRISRLESYADWSTRQDARSRDIGRVIT